MDVCSHQKYSIQKIALNHQNHQDLQPTACQPAPTTPMMGSHDAALVAKQAELTCFCKSKAFTPKCYHIDLNCQSNVYKNSKYI